MANNYTITFKSLRAGTVYTVNIGGGTGTAIPLKGASQPFTTQEDASEDIFTPVRTQSGYIRIVDDGKDANGNALSADWWKDLIPATDTSRPVMLTSGGTVMWQGYMQAQTFSGELFGNPQEREFPVQCAVSSLNGTEVAINIGMLCNFAYLLNYIFGTVAVLTLNNFYFQGGAHAQQWLLKKFDWSNFLNFGEDGVTAKYNLLQILEDVCRFWGWTCRTYRQDVYFNCVDDTAESTFLALTGAQLTTMAGGTTAGTVNTTYVPFTIGNVFASTANEDTQMRGPGKAVVKADANVHTDIVEFAPQSVRDIMEQGGYTWVQGDGDMIGYFTTTPIASFDTSEMAGTSNGTGSHFCRRQIFQSADSDGTDVDMILMHNQQATSPNASLETKYARSYSGGSFKLTGTIYDGAKTVNEVIFGMRIGIGETRASAKWFHLDNQMSPNQPLIYGWSSSPQMMLMFLVGSSFNVGCIYNGIGFDYFLTAYIPTYSFSGSGTPVMENLYGKLFIDFFPQSASSGYGTFEIGDFTVEFTRDYTALPTTPATQRARTMKEERETSHEYTAIANNKNLEEWNCDVIFASDNNMEIGRGLLMNADASFMATALYAGGNEHPEQHLANRVADYWEVSRQKIVCDLQSQADITNVTIANVSPLYKATLNGKTFHPVSINREWRDDKSTFTLLEIPT